MVDTDLLREVRDNQAQSFMRELLLCEEAQAYLKHRGITQATIEQFGIGYDASKHAIVFPDHDEQGVVGFTFRSVDEHSALRYWNSANDSLYSKGELLPGLHQVLDRAIEQGKLYVVEGRFDALHLVQVGVAAVPMQGSSLSEAQLSLLKHLFERYGIVPVLIPDNDAAGEEGLCANQTRLEQLDIAYRTCRVPKEYKDIAEYLTKSEEGAIVHKGVFAIKNDQVMGKGVHAVLVDVETNEKVWETFVPIGEQELYEAQYHAFLSLVKEVIERNIDEVSFRGLQQLVVKQVLGEWQVSKSRLHRLCTEIRSFLPEIPRWRFDVA